MKYVILPPQAVPKKETVHHRPKTLGEMKMAFLNANNRKDWADESVVVTEPPPPSATFKSRKKFVIALNEKKRLLMRRERDRFQETLHTVPESFEDALIKSQSAALALMRSPSALLATEYFTQRSRMYDAFVKKELAQYIVSPEIEEFVKLLDHCN
jgi:hypothetical protein